MGSEVFVRAAGIGSTVTYLVAGQVLPRLCRRGEVVGEAVPDAETDGNWILVRTHGCPDGAAPEWVRESDIIDVVAPG
ncbi:hypothetical protein [Amycolatopsis sp. SID8362]|uniref:hypothetical protein n=1 Tax=Amycolatopsis sp. SID8362 TaxID=2690346 RepID=UPI001369DA30|nr:hypothetical protein [Amycolatopsis sp. SID8362]NBH02587.1 hypothetical protein [Amycolatopsis sp. SID8362]NED39289.1 hypothetical protein [Amycolatopsis sp. SID8362]